MNVLRSATTSSKPGRVNEGSVALVDWVALTDEVMESIPVQPPDPLLARIEAALRQGGEVVLTRDNVPVARVLPLEPTRPVPSRAALRATMPRLSTPSETHIRADRDDR